MDTETLTTTIAQLLADRTGWAWQPNGPAYTNTQVGVFYGAIGANPDQAVGITVYTTDDPYPVGANVRRVQLRFRGLPGVRAGADTLADTAFAHLHGLARVAGINLATRVSMAHLGADESDRQERADNYQIILDNPEA